MKPKWHWVWHILCLTTTAIAKDLSIELRSKGDPPKLLQHHVQQKLMSSYVPGEKSLIEHLKKKDEFHTTRAPFREGPYKFEDIIEDDILQDDTGISVAVDERTFNTINANMGTFVKDTAKDWRGVVNGAAKFVHGSIQKTLRPKIKRPQSLKSNYVKNVKGSGGLLSLFGLLGDKNKPEASYGPPNSQAANPTYGAPTVTPSYPSPTPTLGTPSSAYGVPSAPVITSDYASPQSNDINSNYGTNFNDIGPSIQSLQKTSTLIEPTTTPSPTANPFLLTTPKSNRVTTPFSDTIFRPKRKRAKKPRPGTPPPNFFISSTPSPPRPSLVTSFRTTTAKPIINQIKDKDLEDVKLAWYRYYKKAANYVNKYKERIDVKQFRRDSLKGNTIAKKPRPRVFLKPSISTPGPHPVPFSGQVLPQLPFKARPKKPTKIPFFTVTRSRLPPRPPTLRPMRRKPSLNFLEGSRRDQIFEMDGLHDTLHYDYVIDDDIFAPNAYDYYQDEEN